MSSRSSIFQKSSLSLSLWISLAVLFSVTRTQAEDPPAGGIAGAVKMPLVGEALDENEIILYELKNYQSQPGKMKMKIALGENLYFRGFDLDDLHPNFARSGPQRTWIRSIALGSKVGLVIRVGDSAHVNTFVESANNFAVFRESVPSLEKPFMNNWGKTNIVLFRKDLYSHPPGVAFSNIRPWSQLSGPMADDYHVTFFLPNTTNSREIPTPVNNSMPWATLYGKGTKLTVWVNGQPREIEAISDDPRENSFYLPDEGMRLDKIDFTNKKRGSYPLPRMKITAPPPPNPTSSDSNKDSNNNTGNNTGNASPKFYPSMAGNWKQLPGNSSLPATDVSIGQNMAKPQEFACKVPQMKVFGKGTVDKEGKITASFGPGNADLSGFGIFGPTEQVTGKVTQRDATGRAMRIDWSNGVVYERK